MECCEVSATLAAQTHAFFNVPILSLLDVPKVHVMKLVTNFLTTQAVKTLAIWGNKNL